MHVLILDDDPARSERLSAAVARGCPGAVIARAPAGEVGRALDDAAPGLVVLGPGAADGSAALELVRLVHERRPELPLVVVSTRDAALPAVAAMKAGAADYLFTRDGEECDALARAVARLARMPHRPTPVGRRTGLDPLAGLVGKSTSMQRVRELVRTAARFEAHVLLEGETGTGKEVVARAVHALGRRAGGPFVPVNCAAIPETLAESELFGHARGAFTGALQERAGALQLAERGTLFLDEVEDLSLPLQAKLLRVVQDREVRPLGSGAMRRVDVRLIAASNRDLAHMVERGEFRRDLFYRLRVFVITLPPLRQRREDLPLLIEHFVARFNTRHATALTLPPPSALRPLLEHSWPGNVRELENALESLLVLASAGGAEVADLLRGGHVPTGFAVDERGRILRVLEEHRWNRQRAAAALGISRVTLWRRMERHGIRDPLGAAARETV